MRMLLKLFALASAVAAVELCSLTSIQASAVTYTQALGPSPQNTMVDVTLILPEFDSSLGTLNSVQITVHGSLATSVGFENLSPGALGASTHLVRMDLTQVLAVTLGAQPLLTMTQNTSPDYYNKGMDEYFQNISAGALTAFDGTIDYAGTSGFTTALWNVAGTATYTPGTISDFVGTGTFGVDVNATGYATTIAPGNSNVDIDSLAGTSVTVEYDYTATPEPATLTMLGAGLFGMVVLRRHGRKRPEAGER